VALARRPRIPSDRARRHVPRDRGGFARLAIYDAFVRDPQLARLLVPSK
jgi:hypothetical protein